METLSNFPTRRWVLIGGAAIVGALAVRQYRLTPEDFAGGQLTVSEAHAAALEADITLIDIRQPEEWRATGIPEGAEPLDMRRADFITALDDLVGSDRSRPVALICARGVRSARMANMLSAAGFTRIIDVPEGMLGSRAGPGWLASDLPVSLYQEGNG